MVEEFTATFRLIQQAYEVLSDPHERAWYSAAPYSARTFLTLRSPYRYDSHREQILTSKDTAEQNVDIFSYFNTACYSGYGDDGKGFYAVYQRIFDEISLEDRRYAKEAKEELEIPLFGKSISLYGCIGRHPSKRCCRSVNLGGVCWSRLTDGSVGYRFRYDVILYRFSVRMAP